MLRSLLAVLIVAVHAGCLQADDITIRLNGTIDGKSKATIDVTGIDAATLDALVKSKLDRAQWTALFTVRVAGAKTEEKTPALLGSYGVEDGVIRFEPRFPLARGIRYRAAFHPSRLPGRNQGKAVTAEFHQAKPVAKRTTVVEHVYPTPDRLPENQLKFYIHFSAPMSEGGSYRHVRLLAADGKPIELPFLELDEELWDPESKRFTLYLDPGRIKRGLKPREEAGPILEEGKSYTLAIDSQWPDAEGNPLRDSHQKKFTVGPPDENAIEPQQWKLTSPLIRTRRPLVVCLGKPLDHALLQRLLWVVDSQDQKVKGTVTVEEEETLWKFTPEVSWSRGTYHLVVDKALEDLAGNNVGRPFEVDVFRPIQRRIKAETVRIPFHINHQ